MSWGRGPLVGMLVILAFIWGLSSLLPAESAWRFGPPFKVFFSVIAILGSLFFLLLKASPISGTRSQTSVFGSIILVFSLTVGGLIMVASVFPQFEIPHLGGEAAGGTPEERGKALFQNPAAGCNRCHTIAGRGGTRGPDLTEVGNRAGTRKPGMSADEYLWESITNPKAFVVPDYSPLMRTDFAKRLSKTQINDLIAYLKTLK
ncbi:MAG: c-type cytochrome [Dehalococcoidia bacterium]